MNEHKHNLDHLAATYSQKMVEVIGEPIKGGKHVKPADADNLYTKAMGVLQEHGLYAMALYLLYRSGSQSGGSTSKYKAEELVATQAMAHLWAMLKEKALIELQVQPRQDIGWKRLNTRDQKKSILSHFSDNLCASDLGRLFFIKKLFEQTLIYARYHARATPEEGDRQ